MVHMVAGDRLTAEQKREVCARYVARYTGEHMPYWARGGMPDGTPYPLQFSSDADWLANTLFAVTASGRLAKGPRYCQSSPTWPNNPELRKA